MSDISQVDFWMELIPAYIAHYEPPLEHLKKHPRVEAGGYMDTTKFSKRDMEKIQQVAAEADSDGPSMNYADET